MDVGARACPGRNVGQPYGSPAGSFGIDTFDLAGRQPGGVCGVPGQGQALHPTGPWWCRRFLVDRMAEGTVHFGQHIRMYSTALLRATVSHPGVRRSKIGVGVAIGIGIEKTTGWGLGSEAILFLCS